MALMLEVLEEPSKNEHKYIVCVGEHLSRFLFCEGEYSEESQKAAERTFERMLQQDEWVDARPFGNVVDRLEMLALDVVEEERGMV